MSTQITPLYAGILGLILVVLGIRVIVLNPGDATEAGEGSKQLRFDKGMQAFNNFTDVHVLCLGLLAGRLSHAIGVSQVNEKLVFRIVGMALTFIVITAVAVRLVLS